MAYEFDIAIIGRCVQDHIFYLDSDLTEMLQTDDVRVEASDCITMGGGPGATAAVTMAKMGLKVAFIGRVGPDKTGKQIRDELNEYGVCVSGLETDNGIKSRTALVLVNTKSNSRSFAACGTTFPDKLNQQQLNILKNSRALHIDWFNTVALQAVQLFNGLSRQITYDVFKYRPEILQQTRLCTLACVSKTAAKQCLQDKIFETSKQDMSDSLLIEHAGILHDVVCKQTIVTLGEKGSLLCTEQGAKYYAAFPPERVLDTTGAGDVFNGALAASLVLNKSLEEGIYFATAAAAISCEGLGGRGRIPSINDVNEFLVRRGSK